MGSELAISVSSVDHESLLIKKVSPGVSFWVTDGVHMLKIVISAKLEATITKEIVRGDN